MHKNNISQVVSLRFLFSLILLLPIHCVFADQLNYNVNDQNTALHGYDPVSYFQGQPTEGLKTIHYQHDTINYLFSSQENMKLFIKNPDTYVPVFGGYCAYGVRVGKKFDIDPQAYAIEEGKLYVLLDRSTKNLWDQERQRNIAIAKRLWSSIQSVPSSDLNN